MNRVNFDVSLDTRIAIVGANGAGKSTLWVFFPSILDVVLRIETE